MAPATYTFANDSAFDVEALRARLARMDDATLERFGRSAAYMCSPRTTENRPEKSSLCNPGKYARNGGAGTYLGGDFGTREPRASLPTERRGWRLGAAGPP
jgi:hypothetical protein